MTAESLQIDIGVVELGEPTLLLVGDPKSFRWLAGEIQAHQDLVIGKQRVGGHRASLRISSAPVGSELLREGSDFCWRLSSAEAQKVAQQLSALAETARPAHAYLDAAVNSAAVQIVASVGEYGADQIF